MLTVNCCNLKTGQSQRAVVLKLIFTLFTSLFSLFQWNKIPASDALGSFELLLDEELTAQSEGGGGGGGSSHNFSSGPGGSAGGGGGSGSSTGGSRCGHYH